MKAPASKAAQARMPSEARARGPRRDWAISPATSSVILVSFPCALPRACQCRDHRRPAVDLALHKAPDLGRAHGHRFDCVLLDLPPDLRPVRRPDDLAIDPLDDVG